MKTLIRCAMVAGFVSSFVGRRAAGRGRADQWRGNTTGEATDGAADGATPEAEVKPASLK
jgi:hypothetical protein